MERFYRERNSKYLLQSNCCPIPSSPLYPQRARRVTDYFSGFSPCNSVFSVEIKGSGERGLGSKRDTVSTCRDIQDSLKRRERRIGTDPGGGRKKTYGSSTMKLLKK
jgi:hypothetical protein